MKIKPILFNAEMVRAILDGRKTVTRRVVKTQPPTKSETSGIFSFRGTVFFSYQYDGTNHNKTSPYLPDDTLWVRETWRPTGTILNPYAYRAAESDLHLIGEAGESLQLKYRWHPSIHMPKEAARIWLLVKNVRVERLQDIDCAGARAEGCDGRCECPSSGADGSLSCVTRDFSVERFETVWDSTIKPADLPRYGWHANPWVWVIEFARCEKPKEATK